MIVIFYAYTLSLISVLFKLYVYCSILPKNLHKGFCRACCNCAWFLVVNEKMHPPGPTRRKLVHFNLGHRDSYPKNA